MLEIVKLDNPVQKLRDNGVKVRVTHYRKYRLYDSEKRKMVVKELAKWESPGLKYAEPYGGRTVVEITNPDNETHSAEAICCEYDAFTRKDGVNVAMNKLAREIFYYLEDHKELSV